MKSGAGLEAPSESHQSPPESTKQRRLECSTQPPRLSIVTLCVCVGGFLTQLDRTIVTTALPQITDDFRSFSDYNWYGCAYMLTACACQPVFGQTYTHFDTRWTYTFSFALFEVGSIVCGSAPSSAALIIGRAISGVGAAGMLTGAFVALTEMVSKRQLPVFISLVSIVVSLGTLVGPLIGGAFTSRSTWRWCFYINLPIGLPALVGVAVFFNPITTQHNGTRQVSLRQKLLAQDARGLLLFAGGIAMFLLALHYAAERQRWSSSLIVGLLTGAGCSIASFVLWTLYKRGEALIPSPIITHRLVFFSAFTQFLLWAAIILHTYFIPIYFQAIRGRSAIASGVDMIPYIVPAMMGSLVADGCAIAMIGAGLVFTFDEQTSAGKWVGFELLTGSSIGLATQQGFIAVQACLRPGDVPMGIALINLATNLGGAVFVSVGNTVLLNDLRKLTIAGLDTELVIQAGATAFRSLAPSATIPLIVVAYAEALKKVFLAALVLLGVAFLSSIGMTGKPTSIGMTSTSQRDDSHA